MTDERKTGQSQDDQERIFDATQEFQMMPIFRNGKAMTLAEAAAEKQELERGMQEQADFHNAETAKQDAALAAQQLADLGSAEVNAWTVTDHDGTVRSLSDHAEHEKTKEQKGQELADFHAAETAKQDAGIRAEREANQKRLEGETA